MITRKKAEITIAVLFEAMDICLNDDIDYTTEERIFSRVAYINLNALRNSLHRFLVVDKSAKSGKVKKLVGKNPLKPYRKWRMPNVQDK